MVTAMIVFQLVMAVLLVAIACILMKVEVRSRSTIAEMELALKSQANNQRNAQCFFAFAVALVISAGFLVK